MAYGPEHNAAVRLAMARWGNQVAVRAAQTVSDRVDQLPAGLRQAVNEATRDEEAEDDG